MLPDDECRILANLFSLLSHPTRLQFFCLLRDGEKTVGELAQAVGISPQNASQHLRLMRESGLVRSFRNGQQVRYRLANPLLGQGLELLREALLQLIQNGLPGSLRDRLVGSSVTQALKGHTIAEGREDCVPPTWRPTPLGREEWRPPGGPASDSVR